MGMAEAIKVSDCVIQFVAGQGVRHVFMLPGGGTMHLDDLPGRWSIKGV